MKRRMPHEVSALIDHQWTVGQAQASYSSPANCHEVLGTYPLLSTDSVDSAVQAAQRAAVSWNATPAPKRAECIARAARLLEARLDIFAEAIACELGRPIAETRSEITRSVTLLDFMAGEGRRMAGETLPSETANRLIYTVRQALGVVAVITPWNFPVAIALWKIAPALICGNCVIFKPASITPRCGELVTRLFIDAGVPMGVLQMLTGTSAEIARPLVQHAGVQAISFTGSTAVGREIYAQGANRGARVQCEMGGKNPLVVLDDANLDKAAYAAVHGAFDAAGQRCTATSRVIVVDRVADAFIERLVHETQRFALKTPLAHAAALEDALTAVRHAQAQGARLLVGGHRSTAGSHASGYFMAPTLLSDVVPSMDIAKQEIFAPLLCVMRVNSLTEAIAVANCVEYGLSAAIYTANLSAAHQFAAHVATGIVHINEPTMGSEVHAPFGGVKATSVGYREKGSAAIEFYSEIKTVYLNYAHD